jgi:predicted RNA methylase
MRKVKNGCVSAVRKITDRVRGSTRSSEKLHKYWKDDSDLNKYVAPIDRSEFLFGIIESLHIEQMAQILELGCGVGRNLNYLFLAGFQNLVGVEINPNAIQMMQQVYPEVVKKAKIIEGSLEEIVRRLKEREFELVFTMATLQHIHPNDIHSVCGGIFRITKSHLITIENESPTMSSNKFARNYKKFFESAGFAQVREVDIPIKNTLHGHTARVFKRVK